jgi:hypothetical protein
MFICGVASAERPVEVIFNDRYLLATSAISYSLVGCHNTQRDNHGIEDIECRDGFVHILS